LIIAKETKNLQLKVQRRIRTIKDMKQKKKDFLNRQGYSARSIPLRYDMIDAYKIWSVIVKMNRE